MTAFWIALGVLTLAALLFPLWALWRHHQVERVSSGQLNASITRQRLQELDVEVAEGLLSERDYQQAVEDVKTALVLEQHEERPSHSKRSWLALLIGTVIAAVVTAVVYVSGSGIESLQHWQQTKGRIGDLGKRIVVDADPSITRQDLSDFALALRTRLQAEPDAPEGWLLLGRVHASLNRHDAAIEAFDKSLALDGSRDSARLNLAQSLVSTGREENLTRALHILSPLKEATPGDSSVLGLMAIAATQLGQKDLAIDSWQELAAMLPDDNPMQAEIDARIGELTGKITGIDVVIELAGSLRDQVPEDGMLVVFARPSDTESGMPVAVVRQPVSQWPVQVTLTDADSVMPSQRLSDLQQVTLTARVSADGDVMAASGELQGQAQVILTPQKTVKAQIRIDKELE
ncbi:Cytochrome c-type bioproteinis protein CcmH [Saliniradius amylolyticus]|uniref:Cytochrome c-type bioproteinis protein CcmH n=1 Tax=Saliniradius amylolyticus TaxID=2183582 RepID=A0A2S2E116_9ALTE|nr:c-type cytochrome biogenesis protein CcmI [Saliniradius amylolyticus]AWL11313.1 Cytochrome c-type bioproteinis protein CcmH [Saliniradius amylolyticus]